MRNVLVLVLLHLVVVNAFTITSAKSKSLVLCSQNDPNQEERLKRLGYSSQELSKRTQLEPPKTLVKEVEVDAFTLTAVGFGLITLNFFVFANMGDGGIAGVVATIINKLNEY